MTDIDCYDITSKSGLSHGLLLKEGDIWTYRRANSVREVKDEVLKNNSFTLYKNSRYVDKDGVDPSGNGVKSAVDWAALTVTTSTGLVLKLEPNKFTERSE